MASLPKGIKTIQDTQAGGSSRADTSNIEMIMHTSLNAKCAYVIGIPHEALIEGERVGTGSFGICRRLYRIKGISFFLENINYVGKCYKGGPEAKLNNFQTK